MSRELPYFPPNGLRWTWAAKTLAYSAWSCDLSSQKEGDTWPMQVALYVDLIDGKWLWDVAICDFQHRSLYVRGSARSGRAACLAAERRGEKELSKLLPEWVRLARVHGWRPSIRG